MVLRCRRLTTCWLSGDRAGSRRYCKRRRGNGQLFQWVQDLSSLFWSEEEIDARLDTIMRHAIESVWQKAQALAIPLRTAAWALACERILQASKDRGLYS